MRKWIAVALGIAAGAAVVLLFWSRAPLLAPR